MFCVIKTLSKSEVLIVHLISSHLILTLSLTSKYKTWGRWGKSFYYPTDTKCILINMTKATNNVGNRIVQNPLNACTKAVETWNDKLFLMCTSDTVMWRLNSFENFSSDLRTAPTQRIKTNTLTVKPFSFLCGFSCVCFNWTYGWTFDHTHHRGTVCLLCGPTCASLNTPKLLSTNVTWKQLVPCVDFHMWV